MLKRNVYLGALFSGAFVLGAVAASAQEVPAPPPPAEMMLVVQSPDGPGEPPPPPAFGERLELLGIEGIHPGKVVTGAPFSAMATSETTQKLADGNHISRKSQANLYRDSQGRFRREGTFTGFGPMAASGPGRSFVLIHDPVAGTAYVLEPETKTAHQMPRLGQLQRLAEGGPGKAGLHARNNANTQVQDLGTQTIAGLTAQGKRVTHTIPAGQIGNDQPIVSTFETWYSPDLQIVVMSKRSDPRFGDTTYTVTNIQRTEPAASLFTLPSDYTVKQGGFGRHGRHAGGPGAPPPAGDAPVPPPAD